MMGRKGLFLSFEGLDGSGKTTQIDLLADWLRGLGYEVVKTREPGGTPIGEKIRNIVLDVANTGMDPVCETLLYAASRAQHVAELIRPALEEGACVLTDRFVDSSYVYQGTGRGLPAEVRAINAAAIRGTLPDMTFFLDLGPERSLRRRTDATSADRIESERMDFHRKVYEAYRKLAEEFPERIRIVPCAGAPEDIQAIVRRHVTELIENGTRQRRTPT
jgi:dTMP kinase